jgi:glycine betaine catabolism B
LSVSVPVDWTGTPAPAWDASEDGRLVCLAVRPETHDVKTFLFAPAKPGAFRFTPGQFLTFTFEIDGQPVSRCYTISSPPTRPDRATITVKRVQGGPVSNWLHDNLRPGGTVSALGPFGSFSSFAHPARKYLFLSGGSGITPLMSMARAYHDLGEAADIVFVHNARTPADIIFRGELATMARQSPNFRFAPICETDAPDEAWAGYRGRISPSLLQLIAPDFREREIFTCGPSPYMAAVRGLLGDAGFDMAHYHEESFDFDEMVEEEIAEAASDATAFRIEFAKSGRTVTCDAGTTILAAARTAGLKLPSACTKGICGTCKSGLIAGQVDMNHGGGIRQREIDRGLILLCCSKPLTDLVIDR